MELLAKIIFCMTYNEVVDFFQSIIDDQPDTDLIDGLADTSYTNRNQSRVWAFLMKLDTSITHSPGNTYATEKSLPSDFGSMVKLNGGTGDNEYDGVPFIDIHRWQSQPNKYALDIANSKMRLTGSVSSALTMQLFYQYVPTSLFGLSSTQKDSATTIVWPARFHRLLAYDMAAAMFGGVDADEITQRMSPAQRAEAHMLAMSMIKWDNRNLLKMMGGSSTSRRSEPGNHPDVVSW